MKHYERTTTVLLALIALILLIGAMRLTASVTLPLAFAVFVTMVMQPLYDRVRTRTSRRITCGVVIAIVLLLLWLFVWGLAESFDEVAEHSGGQGAQKEQFSQIAERVEKWGASVGMSLNLQDGFSNLSSYLASSLKAGLEMVGMLVLFIGFFILAVLELEKYRAKFRSVLAERLAEPARSLSGKFHRYILVRTAICAISGVFAGVSTWAFGIDFPLIWAFLTFLLNYIPTLGTVVAVALPTLYALVQFSSPVTALWILLGLAVFELVMGNYIDPRLQGRSLQLSPLVVLFSMAFWGWVWGIGGALLAVPMTVAVVVCTHNFHGTAWISALLTENAPPAHDEPPRENVSG